MTLLNLAFFFLIARLNVYKSKCNLKSVNVGIWANTNEGRRGGHIPMAANVEH